MPKKELDLKGKAHDLAHVLASIHAAKLTTEEAAVYQRYLVDGGDEQNTSGHQRQLAGVLREIGTDDFSMADLQRAVRLAEKRKLTELAERLRSIERLEYLIVAAANLFSFLLRCDGRRSDRVANDVRAVWGQRLKMLDRATVTRVEEEIGRIGQAPDAAVHLGKFGRHAADGDWHAAAESLIDYNTFVMKRRGGAPWIRNEKSTLRVDYRDEGADLGDPADLERPWRNTYFINALYGIERSVTQS
jgi:hypothetical protein